MAEAALSGAAHPLLENDYASDWMGIEVLGLADGHATLRMPLRQEMLNGFGMAHGGMIFAFGDTAFALACNPANPQPDEQDVITVASGVDINFLKPAFRGQVLTAVANRRASTGRSGLYDVQIYAADAAAADPAAPPVPSAAPGGLTADIPGDTPGATPGATPAGELIAEFRGRSRTISRK